MRCLEKILSLVHTSGNVPSALSVFHISFILGVILLSFLLCRYFRNAGSLDFRLIILTMWIVMISLEIIKQIFTPMSIVDGQITYSYQWVMFPFQLCSTPLYVLPLLALLPDGCVRDAMAAYTMTIGLIGGVAVYLVPRTVLNVTICQNYQTMIHHGLQIVSGVYTAAYYRYKLKRSFYVKGISAFAIAVCIACLLNTVGYDMFVAMGIMADGSAFNMFYISPRVDQIVPVLNDVLKTFNPIVYILGYFIVLSALSAGVMLSVKWICELSNGKYSGCMKRKILDIMYFKRKE